jgi:hypothetical protein
VADLWEWPSADFPPRILEEAMTLPVTPIRSWRNIESIMASISIRMVLHLEGAAMIAISRWREA